MILFQNLILDTYIFVKHYYYYCEPSTKHKQSYLYCIVLNCIVSSIECIEPYTVLNVELTNELRCAISYHNILHKGFALMQGPAGVASINKSSDALIGEESMPASEFLQASVLPSSSGELYSRALRIKALKTFAWLSKKDTLHDLLMTCATIQPLERIMWVFLSWQSDGAILDSDSSPLGIMASETSPARVAIDKLLELMLSGRLFESSDLPDLLTIARF